MGYNRLVMFIIPFIFFAAVGSIFFIRFNETLWGEIATSMLTLFRVCHCSRIGPMFMYEKRWKVVSVQLDFYIIFIFLTAFLCFKHDWSVWCWM